MEGSGPLGRSEENPYSIEEIDQLLHDMQTYADDDEAEKLPLWERRLDGYMRESDGETHYIDMRAFARTGTFSFSQALSNIEAPTDDDRLQDRDAIRGYYVRIDKKLSDPAHLRLNTINRTVVHSISSAIKAYAESCEPYTSETIAQAIREEFNSPVYVKDRLNPHLPLVM